MEVNKEILEKYLLSKLVWENEETYPIVEIRSFKQIFTSGTESRITGAKEGLAYIEVSHNILFNIKDEYKHLKLEDLKIQTQKMISEGNFRKKHYYHYPFFGGPYVSGFKDLMTIPTSDLIPFIRDNRINCILN